MKWIEITVTVPAAEAPRVVDLLRPFSPTGTVTEEQWGDPADLAPQALLPEVLCKIYRPADDFGPQLQAQLTQLLGTHFPELPAPTFIELAETDWTMAWRDNYQTFRLGRRLVIQPSWLVEAGWPEPTPEDIPIVIDPGMAFGTGLHETTRLCLVALEELVRPQMSLLDLGTGSGILSFAAARLGAHPIMAVDNDPVAVRAARQNAVLNGLDAEIQWVVGSLDSVSRRGWDLVVVNILAVVIEEMIRESDLLQYAAPGGAFLFSGIIAEQRTRITAALATVGGRIVREWSEGDWLAMLVQPQKTQKTAGK